MDDVGIDAGLGEQVADRHRVIPAVEVGGLDLDFEPAGVEDGQVSSTS
ncbi:MAG: hypothetical protein R2694_07275 [Ilumatobacteraceae bacterium]